MYIGQNIKYLRKRVGMTADDLAHVVDKSRNAITQYEIGRSQPPSDVLVKLSSFFKVSVDALLSQDLSESQNGHVSEPEEKYAPEASLWDYRKLVEVVGQMKEEINHLKKKLS